MRSFLLAALPAVILISTSNAGGQTWIDRYFAAHDSCARKPVFYSMAPLNKPIEQWTDHDLVDLKAALDRCDALPDTQTGGMTAYWSSGVYRMVAEGVREQQERVARQKAAKQAEADHAAQADQARQQKIAADKAAAAQRLAALKKEADQEDAARKAIEEQTAATAEELKAAAKLANAREAKARAAQAEARARNGVEEAKKRAADAEDQARRADTNARAERDAANRRVAEAQSGAGLSETSPKAGSLQPPYPSSSMSPPGHQSAPATPSREALVPAVTSENYVACKALSDLVTTSRAILRNDGDTGAALVNAGQCFLIPQGTHVRVKAADAEGNDPKVACVYIMGHAQCLWMPMASIENSDEASD